MIEDTRTPEDYNRQAKGWHTVEVEATTFEVWEFYDCHAYGNNPRWIRLDSGLDTLQDSLDFIDECYFEYDPIIEIREIEIVNYIEEEDGPEFEYD
jgi:hypothetical protein